jgi:hypothetical protein
MSPFLTTLLFHRVALILLVTRTKFCLLTIAACCGLSAAMAAEPSATAHFREQIRPILSEYCFECHGDGMNKGGIAFDELQTDKAILDPELWLKVLKNTRAHLMPPPKKRQPSQQDRERLEEWIKFEAFGIDSKNLDPGRVTVRRLNRAEYRNTVRDLLGVEFDAENEFPPDDTGYGFDNIADVLTVSPLLLEKYLAAAKTIVNEAVPMVSKRMPERTIFGNQFHSGDGSTNRIDGGKNRKEKGLLLSYYEPSTVSNTFTIEHSGQYELVAALTAVEKHVENQFDYNKCRLIFKADGQELLRKEFVREGGKGFHYEFKRDIAEGEHVLTFELQPVTPDEKQVRSLAIRIDSVTIRGPVDEKYWIRPKNYERVFTKEVPKGKPERRAYAGELLGNFAMRAFRRPADAQTVERLVALAEDVYRQPGKTFEAGIAHSMVAVLASPRFTFREEAVESNRSDKGYPFLDEYSLASRLSYFLWSSMPDAELFRLAGAGELRKNLAPQVNRMLADPRSKALVQNFSGQWLQSRDIDTVVIDARAVLGREEKVDPDADRRRARFRMLRNKPDDTLTPAEKDEMAKMRLEFIRKAKTLRTELTGELRQAMRQEVEMYFGNIVRQDRSVMEFVQSDYTFLNERLASHYGLTNLNITGDEMRRVTLPPDSPRGGVLTMGSVLAVTSNPTRTSPVKRGLFILDNILGLPPAPPPPDIPPLEDAAKDFKGREPTLRETLELHRDKPLCSSCHNRMDPLGLAMENFNAMGMWREKERDQPVEVSGTLLTGENFSNVQELKRILADNHRHQFYECLTEKLLTYAIGRGLEYSDVETVDQIVEKLEKNDGRFSSLLMGVIESSPFQKRRISATVGKDKARNAAQRADVTQKP